MRANGLLKTIENHIIVVIVTISVATGTVVFGVVNYFHNQEIKYIENEFENKRTDLEKITSSIERSLDGNRFLDIGKLVSIHLPEEIDPSLSHFHQMNFFARRDEAKWDTKYITEVDHIEQTVGVDLSNIFAGDIVNEMNRVFGFRWLGKKSIKFQYKEQENSYIEERPFIFVQKFGRSDNLNYIRVLSASFTRQSWRAGESAIREIKELMEGLATATVELGQVSGIPTGIFEQNDLPGSLISYIATNVQFSSLG
jgi:hypothetical protein